MSIYSKLKPRLAGLEDAKRPSSQQAAVILASNGDGDPLVGIQYACDFRSEEETGAGEMASTFTRAADAENFFAKEYLLKEKNLGLFSGITQADLVIETDTHIAFAAKTHVYDAQRELDQATRSLAEANDWFDGRWKLRRQYWHSTAPEMREEAKARGLKGYSKLRVKELENLLVEDDFAKANADKPAEEITMQPGWFHFGSLLVFEKKDGLFGEVLQLLVAAAKAGHLVVGGGGIGAFGSGFSFFDGRELTEEAKDEISANNRWYREQMDNLKPVAAIVEQGPMKSSWGSAYFALGNPRLMEDGIVKYWLNGNSVKFPNGRSKQPFGYYSLQELLDEKYMDDAAADVDESFKRYTAKGSSRSEGELTDEQAEAELKSLGLRWASKPMGDD